MHVTQYQHDAARTSPWPEAVCAGEVLEGEARERLLYAAVNLAGEAGEVLDEVKKVAWHGHALDRARLREELGDVLWGIAEACSALGLDLADVMRGQQEKARERYPDGWDPVRSQNRTR